MAKSKKPLLVLLDAHAVLHRAYHALPDFSTRSGEPTGALFGLISMLLSVAGELKPDYIAACFDLPQATHRHEQFKDYKATRKKVEDALVAQINRAQEVLEAFGIPSYELPGFEADDLLGAIAEQVKGDVDVVIASGDMDTLQLVDDKKVQVYTLKRGIKDTIMYDEAGVKERFGFGPELLPDYKGLRGDPSDNIPGIKGVGEKTATTLVEKFGSLENIYKAIHSHRDKLLELDGISERIVKLLEENEDEAFFSKELATIRRDVPIAFDLSDSKWRDNIHEEKMLSMLDQLEFRTLKTRVENFFGVESKPEELFATNSDSSLVREVQVMFWLLDSNKTDPSPADIMRETGAATLEKAYKILEDRVEKNGLTQVWEEIEKPLIPVVEEMNDRGICLDISYLKSLSHEYGAKLKQLEEKIIETAGTDFNISSPKQLSEVLFEHLKLPRKGIKKTSSGVFSTAEPELEKLREAHEIVPLILEQRAYAKLCSTYIDALPKLVSEDGRLRATFVQTGTTTGRMSSRAPNLQNIPIRTELGAPIRNAFVATKGSTLVSLDYSQIELRLAAWLSGDEKMIEVFREGKDIHAAVASEIFNVSPAEVTPSQRSQAKTINFGILYGMGVNALRGNLGEGVSRADSKEFLDRYFESYPRLAEYIEETKRSVYKQGYTTTYFGRRRYFETIRSRVPYIRAQAERMAVNAPLQGTQADIIKKAMVDIHEFREQNRLHDKFHLLMQIHDELVYEVKNDGIEDIALKLKIIMEGVITPDKSRGIVFRADAKIGPNWGEMKSLKK